MGPSICQSEHAALHLVCFHDHEALTAHLAKTLRDAFSARHEDERAIMLSGGSTPFPAYNLLADAPPAPSEKARIFFSDERYVPLDHAQSNYHGTVPLIQALGLPSERVHTLQPELPLEACATAYHDHLRDLWENDIRLPLGILGLGADGHTAALFSQEDLRRHPMNLATWVHRPDGMNGVTVTPRLLRRVEHLIFVITGEGKRERLDDLIKRPRSLIAGQAVAGHPSVEVWCDEDAWPG